MTCTVLQITSQGFSQCCQYVWSAEAFLILLRKSDPPPKRVMDFFFSFQFLTRYCDRLSQKWLDSSSRSLTCLIFFFSPYSQSWHLSVAVSLKLDMFFKPVFDSQGHRSLRLEGRDLSFDSDCNDHKKSVCQPVCYITCYMLSGHQSTRQNMAFLLENRKDRIWQLKCIHQNLGNEQSFITPSDD